MGEGIKLLATNKKARHDYFIEDTYEAGIALDRDRGEVSAREQDQHSRRVCDDPRRGSVCGRICTSAPMKKEISFNADPLRTRKLLLHKREITKLLGLTAQKGYTLTVLSVYYETRKGEDRDWPGAGQETVRQTPRPEGKSGKKRHGKTD